MLALPIMSSGSKGSGMLIGDPLGEGSNASSNNYEIWGAENSFLRMRGNFRRSGVGPKAQTGAWPAQIRARSCAGNPTLWDFRKNAEHSMCELTTGWILEKCPKSSVCTYHNVDFRKNAKHLMCELTTEWILESAQRFSVCTYIYIWYYVL